MSEEFVRLLCTVTSAPDGSWGDLGFRLFRSFHESGVKVRVFANGPGELASGRWAPYGEAFLRSVPATGYINIACGRPADVCLSMTKGVRNIVFTDISLDALKRNEEIVLSQAHLVVVPDQTQASALKKKGIRVVVTEPEKFVRAALEVEEQFRRSSWWSPFADAVRWVRDTLKEWFW